MNLTNPQREQTYTPRCPNCNTDLTGTAKNFGSPAEGDYIVYVCPTCAVYFGTQLDALVYQPTWEPRRGALHQHHR
jgi:hypothetical protein